MPEFLPLMLDLLFFTPLCTALLVFIIPWRFWRWLFMFTLAVSSVGLIIIYASGASTFTAKFSFLGEALTFSFAQSAILVYAVVIISLWLATCLPFFKNKPTPTRLDGALMAIALAFSLPAFLAGQFMLRYIALEVIGLTAALAVIDHAADKNPLTRSARLFITLRVGDLGLWVAILIAAVNAQTLDIGVMIDVAGQLPLDVRLWIFLGFLLAIFIKTAIFPLHAWQKLAEHRAGQPVQWIPVLLMPALGYYLLYRINPLIKSTPLFQWVIFGLVTGLLVVFLLLQTIKPEKVNRLQHMGSLLGFCTLMLAAFGWGQVLPYYLCGILLLRTLLMLAQNNQLKMPQWVHTAMLLLINTTVLLFSFHYFPLPISIFWGMNTLLIAMRDIVLTKQGNSASLTVQTPSDDPSTKRPVLDVLAAAVYDTLETNFFSGGIAQFSNGFEKASGWVHQNIEVKMENLVFFVGEKIKIIANFTLHYLEEGNAFNFNTFFAALTQQLAKNNSLPAPRKLRLDLVWIPVVLVLMLLYLLLAEGG